MLNDEKNSKFLFFFPFTVLFDCVFMSIFIHLPSKFKRMCVVKSISNVTKSITAKIKKSRACNYQILYIFVSVIFSLEKLISCYLVYELLLCYSATRYALMVVIFMSFSFFFLSEQKTNVKSTHINTYES
jgi:hypothetical protein